MSANQWVQVDPSLNRDDVIQWFHNVSTGNRVWGKTSGTLSSNIHLFRQDGSDSGLNLDATSGQVSKDGNLLGDVLAIGALALEAAVGGAVGVGSAAVNASKTFFAPDGSPIDLTGLIFPPLSQGATS